MSFYNPYMYIAVEGVATSLHPCYIPFMLIFAHHAWASSMARYTAISESRAAGNLHVQYFNYRW